VGVAAERRVHTGVQPLPAPTAQPHLDLLAGHAFTERLRPGQHAALPFKQVTKVFG
jgi:hypothetical protein